MGQAGLRNPRPLRRTQAFLALLYLSISLSLPRLPFSNNDLTSKLHLPASARVQLTLS